MATVNATFTDLSGEGSVYLVQWTPLTNTNTDGAPIQACEYADRSVQVEGTFGGATLTVQGSNDGTNWQTLNNAQGTAATFTASGLKQIVEIPRYMRPLLSGGAGSSLTISAVVRRANPMRT